jgi:hypothetical protein
MGSILNFGPLKVEINPNYIDEEDTITCAYYAIERLTSNGRLARITYNNRHSSTRPLSSCTVRVLKNV